MKLVGELFKPNIKLNSHMGTDKEEEKLHICNTCGRRFYKKSDLKRLKRTREKHVGNVSNAATQSLDTTYEDSVAELKNKGFVKSHP